MTRRISFTSEDLVILAGHRKASIRYVAQVMLNEMVLESVSDELDEKDGDDKTEQPTS